MRTWRPRKIYFLDPVPGGEGRTTTIPANSGFFINFLAEASQKVSEARASLEASKASRQTAIDDLHVARAERMSLNTEANAAETASKRADLEKAREAWLRGNRGVTVSR